MRTIKLTITLLFVALTYVAWASSPYSLERAVELYRDGRWIDSNLELLKVKDNIKETNTSDVETIDYYLAMCAVEIDDIEAESHLTNFEKHYPGSIYTNQIRFARALLYSDDGRNQEAKAIFESVSYARLNSAEREKYNMRMGYIYFCEPDYNAATPYFEKIKPKSDVYHHALYYLSYIAYTKGDNSRARSGFDELLSSDAYSAVVPHYLLQLDFNDGRYAKVISEGEELYPNSTLLRKRELSRAMAEAAFRLEDYNKTILYLDKYRVNKGEMNREENYLYGFSLYRSARYRDAEYYLRGACGADDELTQNASFHLADCYLRLRDKSSAMNSFAMAANDKFNAEIAEDALFNYAKLQYELGDDHFSGTINVLSRYLNKYPASQRWEEAKKLLIAAYYNSRNYDAAYASIKEIHRPDADIRLALQRIALYRGLESYNAQEYDMAIASLNESMAVNVSPKYSSVAKFWLGEIAYIRGDYSSALSRYNAYYVSAPRSDENYHMALYNIGYTKLMLGSMEEALGYFQRFVGQNKGEEYYRADAYNRIGDLFYAKRQYSQAKSSYANAIKGSDKPAYYADYQSAIIDGVQGRYDSKISRLKKIILSAKGDYVEDASYELGRSYIVAGDYKQGVEAQERFIATYPNSDKYAQSLSHLGLAHLNLGDSKTSLSYYDRAIKAAPQSAIAKDALQGIREIYINQGDAKGYFDYAASIGIKSEAGSAERDSLTFASAQKLYLNNEPGSTVAINSLSSYINDYPQGYYTTDALFFLSDSYLKAKRNSEAISTLSRLTKQGQNQYSERVYDKLSSLCYAEGHFSQAAPAYKALYEISKKSDVKVRAIEGFVNSALSTGASSTTLEMVEYVEKQRNISPELLVKVRHAKAKILIAKGSEGEAMAIFKELSADPQSAEGAESSYIVISQAFKSGDVDVAEKMIFDLSASDTPQLYWLAKSFIVLGDIYCFRDDFFQARATYQSIIDGYVGSNDGVVEEAQSKINKLPKQ